MSTDALTDESISKAAGEFIVTETHLIRGKVPQNLRRLTDFLEAYARPFVPIDNAEVIRLSDGEMTKTPRALVSKNEIVIAHEYENKNRDPRLVVEVKWVRATLYVRGFGDCTLRGFVQDRTLMNPPPFFAVTNFSFANSAALPQALRDEVADKEYLVLNRDAVQMLAVEKTPAF